MERAQETSAAKDVGPERDQCGNPTLSRSSAEQRVVAESVSPPTNANTSQRSFGPSSNYLMKEVRCQGPAGAASCYHLSCIISVYSRRWHFAGRIVRVLFSGEACGCREWHRKDVWLHNVCRHIYVQALNLQWGLASDLVSRYIDRYHKCTTRTSSFLTDKV